jgi:succinyl-diaminopimelate desuccinylase
MIADPILITQKLLQCPSVTPLEVGTLDLIANFLSIRGFSIERLDSGDVSNLYARLGTSSPHFCFVGHTDVVPSGDVARWSVDPFKGEIRDGKLYGRGTVDMKGGIGAFMAAVDAYLLKTPKFNGSLSLLLTTDEEGPAVDGVRYVVEQFKLRGEKIDACLVGEPTNIAKVGDTVKVGRRGSLNATITIQGKAGHAAYPHLAKNPILPLLEYLQDLLSRPLDDGITHFDPSNLAVTSIDVGNPTTNVIPFEATAKFNIRFNPTHTLESLQNYLHKTAERHNLSAMGFTYTLDIRGSGNAFLCEDKALQNLISQAISTATGLTPTLSTSGGTSDARFMKDICPVIEFGLVNTTAHQVDEHISVEEIHRLTRAYQEILERYFN